MIHTPVIFASLLAAVIPIAIPLFQFGIIFRLWDRYNQPVNKDLCICSCWDTVFKGNDFLNNFIRCTNILIFYYIFKELYWCKLLIFSGGYETGHAEYKHFYFNCNRNTAVIWTFTVIALIGLYEGTKTIFTSVYQGNKHILKWRKNIFRSIKKNQSNFYILHFRQCPSKNGITFHICDISTLLCMVGLR